MFVIKNNLCLDNTPIPLHNNKNMRSYKNHLSLAISSEKIIKKLINSLFLVKTILNK